MKSKEHLPVEGFSVQWFSYIQSRERFKVDMTFGTEKQKAEFVVKFCKRLSM